MKRAAILILTVATLVTIALPSAYPLASATYPTKSGTTPSVVAPTGPATGPATSSDGGSGGGGGSDQGDADGLSGMKVKPGTTTSILLPSSDRVAIALMMWWRYMLLIR
jgi:hypothetical protein